MKIIGYSRVSTTRQGESGLGLEAQQAAITNFVSSNPNSTLIANFVEVESGTKKGNNRPELHKALAMCKQHKATLVIPKLDRLSRSVFFLSGLMEANVDFIALDNPHATKMMLQLLSVFAEHEADCISKRTKEALAAAKARGTKLGSPQNLTKEAQELGRSIANERSKKRAMEKATKLAPTILKMKLEGKSLNKIAEQLNKDGVSTVSGIGSWNASMVRRVVNYV